MDYPDFIRGKCSPEKRDEIERHLGSCSACAALVTDFTYLFSVLDKDRLASDTMPCPSRFGVEVNARIDAPRQRRLLPSKKAQRLLIPLGAAACMILALLAIHPRMGTNHRPILTQEMHAVLSTLDTGEVESLKKSFIDPVTASGDVIPDASTALTAYTDSDVDAGIVFDGVEYTDLLDASLDYLDQSTVIELLPADHSQRLLGRDADTGNL